MYIILRNSLENAPTDLNKRKKNIQKHFKRMSILFYEDFVIDKKI